MNTTTRIAAIALSLFAAGAAMAEDGSYQPAQKSTSTVTRAEVLAQLAQARADGTLLRTDADYQVDSKFVSTKTRAEVRAETLRAIASGELQALNSEGGSFDGRFQAKRAAVAASEQMAHVAK